PIHVIPHAMIDYTADCPALEELERLKSPEATIREAGAAVINQYLVRKSVQTRRMLSPKHPDVQMLQYLEGLSFDDITYVFCSTQNRSYKNIMNLAKAMRLLIRERYRDIKLVMTGYMNFNDPADAIAQYVRHEQLHWDVVSIPRVPRLV